MCWNGCWGRPISRRSWILGHEVEEELGRRTFWNELPDDDIDGRVARYAKTHGPFTVERMMTDLSIDAAGAVHALDMLKARGEVLDGIAAEDGGKAWLHKEVFRRIRARSLAEPRPSPSN
jgi:ATP-dependent Lhr-like helicase